MNIKNNLVSDITKRIDIFMEFCNEEFPTNSEHMKYHVSDDALYITTFKRGNHENTTEILMIEMSDKEQKVDVLKTTRCEENIMTYGDEPMTRYTTYDVIVTNKIIEYQAKNGSLEVTTASLTQAIKESTKSTENSAIVYFDSIEDLQDEKKLQQLPFSNSGVELKKESYEVTDNYKITDGLRNVKKINTTSHQKIKK